MFRKATKYAYQNDYGMGLTNQYQILLQKLKCEDTVMKQDVKPQDSHNLLKKPFFNFVKKIIFLVHVLL